jgi:glycosyltransferase involved in cell wall biosynthesis
VPPLRILYLVTELDPGGAERQLVALATGLSRKRFDPAVASLAPLGALAKPLREAGIPVFSLAARGTTDLRVLPRLTRLLAETEPDLLHTFLFHANVAGRICARLAGLSCPVAASVRVEDPRLLHRWGEKATARWADIFIANSASLGDFLVDRIHIPRARIAVIPNALLPLPAVTPHAFRKALGLDRRIPLVVGVGRLHRQKGFDLLVEALGRWPERAPRPCVALVGTGPEESRLWRLAGRLGVAGSLHLTGAMDSAAGALSDADVVAIPSRWEGMPNVAMEAMALGQPVVAARVGALPELLGGAGVLVPPGDPGALATAIARLLADPGRAQALGDAACERILDYSPARMVDAHVALYGRLLQAQAA